MSPLWALINEVSQQISTVSDNPHFEAELLLANAFKITRAELLSRVREEVIPPPILYHWIERRKEHEPIAYILGYTEFYGIKIHTVPPIFIPRPETELLVEETLKIIEKLEQEPITVLEPCT
jgi:release factor glutamine methyltransferase